MENGLTTSATLSSVLCHSVLAWSKPTQINERVMKYSFLYISLYNLVSREPKREVQMTENLRLSSIPSVVYLLISNSYSGAGSSAFI